MEIGNVYTTALALTLACTSIGALAQASVASMADFKKKQQDGIAEEIRASQLRAQAGKLTMGALAPAKSTKGRRTPAGKAALGPGNANRPPVIHLAAHASAVGVDNRKRINVR